MRFASPLLPATLIRRYKRFLADVALADGTETTVHVANPGAMLGLAEPGTRIWLSRSPLATRKLPHSWELAELDLGSGPELVGVNTSLPNRLVAEAMAAGAIRELAGYARVRREVRYGDSSRVDFLLESDGRPPCFVEVKNVHLMRAPRRAEFPDCVTERGAGHLGELAREVARGARALVLFVVQIGSADSFALARDLDPGFGAAFDRARAAGVETAALACRLTLESIEAVRPIPVLG